MKVCAGQEIPEQFLFPKISYALVNPAFSSTSEKINTSIGSQFHLGEFSDINTSYLVYQQALNSTQNIGVFIYNDNESSLIKRTKFQLLYNYKIDLNENWILRAGVNLGMYQLYQKGNQFIPDVTDVLVDGNLGVVLNGLGWGFGTSVNQFLNNEKRSVDYMVLLKRHYNFLANKKLNISDNTQVEAIVNFRWIPEGQKNVDALTSFIYYKQLLTGASWQREKGIVFHAGIKEITYSNHNLEFYFSYLFPFAGASYTQLEALEINISYFLK